MAIKCPKCHSENTDTARFCSNCAAPIESSKDIGVTKTIETSDEDYTRGTVFAERFEIIEVLGKGGMGKVYRVLDKELDEEVALKLISPEIAADKRIIERFKNELRLARKIGHRNVCRMYELMEMEGKPFISMEYVKGEDLKTHIRRKERLSAAEAIRIAKQVCEGLAEAHRLGVIHRDLKSQNIMIDREGQAKIMDFGIARSVEAPGVTATGIIIGTPDYISPEQAEGKEADQRSDLYSLGVILYEMVTGSVPFKGETAFSVALKHKSQLPRSPKKLNPEISEDFNRLILICLEKERERRYQTAEDLLSDLRNIEEGFPLGTKIRPKRPTFVSDLVQKRIVIPVLAVALVLIGVAVWQIFIQKRAGQVLPEEPSIAVLPFDDLSLLQDQESRCEGLAETLISALSQIDNLYIPARTSAFSFKGKEKNYQEIGRTLGVNFVLDGKIQKEGNMLRITPRIIRISDESQIWGQTYTDVEENIFDIQDQISLEVIDKLKVELLAGEKVRLFKRYTENTEAYDLYLNGLYHWHKRTKTDQFLAIDYFGKAIEKDPDFALAYAGIANAYSSLISYGDMSPKEATPKAEAAAFKALEIDDTLAETHCSMATVNADKWDWEGAEREFKRAIELNPKYALARLWYGDVLSLMARFDEAIFEIEKAKELDPLSLATIRVAGQVYFYAHRFDQAIKEFKKVLAMDPYFRLAHISLGGVYIEMGMYEEALGEIQKEKDLSNVLKANQEISIGKTYLRMGNRTEALKVLDSLLNRSNETYVPPYFLASLYFVLGEIEQGFNWLERAYESRDHWLVRIKIDPTFDDVRSDPRFKALLKKMGLD